MIVIPVPSWVYVAFLATLSLVWLIWVGSDLAQKGVSKYSLKRVLAYVASAAVLFLLWGVFIEVGL